MTPTGRPYNLISADSHVLEPPDLWEKWLERKYLEKAPRLVQDGEGGDAWLYSPEGRPEPLGLVSVVGTPPEKLRWPGSRYGHEVHPACHDGKERLKVLDVDGVDAEVLYPPQRAVMTFMLYKDAELQLAGLQAYNRWMIEGFAAADPSRLLGVAIIPNLGIETSVAELKRSREQGYRAACLAMWPAGNERLTRADDPFWAAAEEMGIPISFHFRLATQRAHYRHAAESRGAVGAYNGIVDFPPLIMDMIFSGVFDRFPRLTMVAAEAGCGWVPHYLEMLDDRYWRNRFWAKTRLNKLPSQYWKENWLSTFISGQDRIGVQIRHAVGMNSIAWSTDFPHHGNDWPYSRRVVNEVFVNVPEPERHQIVAGNAARIYGLV